MLRRLIREEMFSAKIDPERWLVLMKKGLRNWNLRIVGPEPLDVDLTELSGRDAKDQALSVAQEHFKMANPRIVVPQVQKWRLALFSERECSV